MATRQPAEVFPPGEFLREELEERGWTQTDLAEILGRPPRTVNEIIAGKRAISPETAKGLAAALGTSAEFWMNLEAAYQLWRARGNGGDDVARRARIYSVAPVKDMVRRGWIEASDSVDVLERRVLDFFEMKSIDEKPRFLAHAARKSTPYDSITPAQAAWLFRAKQLSRAVHAGMFSKTSMAEALDRLRLLMDVPQEARHVPRVLSEAGIRLVIVQALAGTRIDGACFWVDDGPVIALALRYDRIDNFWFTLMHELGHVNEGSDSLDTDLEARRAESDRPPSERKADQFASQHLIPPHEVEAFIARVRPLYSTRKIEAFAQRLHVHPGIVVGQLQHRGEVVWANFRKLLVPIREWVTASAVTDGWGSGLPARL